MIDLFVTGLRDGSMRCQVEREREELVGKGVRRGVRPSQLRRRLHCQVLARSLTGKGLSINDVTYYLLPH
jgi:hypothetical protein